MAMARYIYICGVCDETMTAKTPSIGCINCRNWVHLKCANLKYKEAKNVQDTYFCPICKPVSTNDIGKENIDMDDEYVNENEIGTDCTRKNEDMDVDLGHNNNNNNNNSTGKDIDQVNGANDSSKSDDLEKDLEAVNEKENGTGKFAGVVKGAKYYLKVRGKNIFIATLIDHDKGDLVHNHSIPEKQLQIFNFFSFT